MIRTFYGACIGAIVGALPALICFLISREKFTELKLIFVLIAGTGGIVGAIAGSTSAVLSSFRKHRSRSPSRRE